MGGSEEPLTPTGSSLQRLKGRKVIKNRQREEEKNGASERQNVTFKGPEVTGEMQGTVWLNWNREYEATAAIEALEVRLGSPQSHGRKQACM